VPAFVAGLTDVGPAGARREQPVELRLLVAVGGVDVDVKSKLATLGFVRPVEDDGGLRTAESGLRRSDLDAGVDAVELDIAEDLAPEPGQQVRIVCVDDEFRYATCHRATLSRGPRPASYTMVRSGAAGHILERHIDGLISWAAGTDARGLRVVAVWESKAHADRYGAEQLFPAFQEFGLAPDMMEMTDYDADEFYLRS
jgi:hypothetical protein